MTSITPPPNWSHESRGISKVGEAIQELIEEFIDREPDFASLSPDPDDFERYDEVYQMVLRMVMQSMGVIYEE